MVFESKNYSGWIFGKEFQRNWYQVLPVGRNRSRKEYFYNPVIQNRSHVKNLKNCIGDTFPIWSIIVFSERCTLKKIEINSNDVSVIKRNDVNSTISFIYNQNSEDLLSESDITNIYNRLYPYTQVDDKVKAEHILNISNNSRRAL